MEKRGVRDPFIIRSAKAIKFYMIATDLKINGENGRGAAQTAVKPEPDGMDNYAKTEIILFKTRDFYTFTEPQVYIDRSVKYRIQRSSGTNDDWDVLPLYQEQQEGRNFGAKTKTVYVERCATLLGEWGACTI